MRKPNLFIVGEPKCGTTSLHYYLKQHPDIFMSPLKEPNFFCKDLHKECIEYWGRKKLKYYFRINEEDEYLKLFKNAKNEKILGEASVYYLVSQVSAKKIYHFNKKAKIIASFREPVSQQNSLYFQNLVSAVEDAKSFEEAINLEPKRRKGERLPKGVYYPSQLYYSEYIKYAEHLKRFLNYFPKENIKVIIFDDLKKDTEGVYKEILSFLGVDDTFKCDFTIKNERKAPRFSKLKVIATNSYKIRGIAQKILPLKVRILWSKTLDKITIKRGNTKDLYKISEEFRKELMKRYKPEVIKINNLLHEYDLIEPSKDLVKLWGYDRI